MMKIIRYVLASLVALAAAAAMLYVVAWSGWTGTPGLPTDLYASAVVYPATLVAFGAVFWIIFAAMDPGTGH